MNLPPLLVAFFIAHDIASELLIVAAVVALVLLLRTRARLQRERATARKARQAVAAYREQLAAWEQHLRERERYLTRQLPHLSQPGRAASRRRPQHDMGWAGLHAGSEPRPMASTLPAPFPETGTGGRDDQAPTERVEIPAPVQWCRKGETTNERNG